MVRTEKGKGRAGGERKDLSSGGGYEQVRGVNAFQEARKVGEGN